MNTAMFNFASNLIAVNGIVIFFNCISATFIQCVHLEIRSLREILRDSRSCHNFARFYITHYSFYKMQDLSFKRSLQ